MSRFDCQHITTAVSWWMSFRPPAKEQREHSDMTCSIVCACWPQPQSGVCLWSRVAWTALRKPWPRERGGQLERIEENTYAQKYAWLNIIINKFYVNIQLWAITMCICGGLGMKDFQGDRINLTQELLLWIWSSCTAEYTRPLVLVAYYLALESPTLSLSNFWSNQNCRWLEKHRHFPRQVNNLV